MNVQQQHDHAVSDPAGIRDAMSGACAGNVDQRRERAFFVFRNRQEAIYSGVVNIGKTDFEAIELRSGELRERFKFYIQRDFLSFLNAVIPEFLEIFRQLGGRLNLFRIKAGSGQTSYFL